MAAAASSSTPPVSRLLPEDWRVTLPVFEGPLDLLLHLIKLNEVDITDIPVATVCDQFHEYLRLMEELDLDIAGEYIYEAALLIQLKSKMLLPRPKNLAGEVVEEDPRAELVQRLLEYRRIKEAAQALAEVDRLRLGVWSRRRGKWEDESEEVEMEELSLFDLLSAFRGVLDRYDREHPDPILLPHETYPVRGQFDRLLDVLDAARPYDLLEDLRTRSCRAEAISAFLAVLELARLRLVRIHQTDAGAIVLYRTTRDLAAEDLESLEG